MITQTVKSDEKAMSLIETLMGTYKSQIDESLRKHMDIVQNLEEKINKQSQIPVPAHLPKTSNPENILYSSPSKEELVIPMRNDALDNESPLTSLKKMLSSYMSSAASVSDSDSDWKVSYRLSGN